MLTINVSSNIEQAMMQLQSIAEAKQFRFAVIKSLTQTAKEVQAEVRKNLPTRFNLRREAFIKSGIRITPATRASLEATVYSRDDFMGLQEYGGLKTRRNGGNYLAVPTSMVRRTPKSVIKKADRPKNLGDKAEVVEINGRQYLALKRARMGANRQRLRLLYLLIPRASITPRLGLNEDGQRIAKERFMQLLKQNLEAALASPKR